MNLHRGATLKVDGFVGRSLFDLFSNFTFFAVDPVYGDEIQQHDSRLQEGVNAQYVMPYQALGSPAVVIIGANFHANQINVGLFPSVGRNPNRKFLPGNQINPAVLLTSAYANVNNYAGYVQNEMSFFDGHLRVEAGLRFDYFTFDVDGFEFDDERRSLIGREGTGELQPKVSIAWSPFDRFPLSIYTNYGRGISSQDARGVVREPRSPKIALTDFYQTGASYNGDRLSIALSSFLIDRSNEQVYIPDDGSTELAGPSRSYGVEGRASLKITRQVSFSGGFTRVLQAYYAGQFTADGSRLIVDSAPRFTANANLVITDLRGFSATMNWRHIASYQLDPDDPRVLAAGHDVVDLSVTRRLNKWLDLNFSVDNLMNKTYYETQNLFESQICPTCIPLTRIHATPGYPFAASVGVSVRLGTKN